MSISRIKRAFVLALVFVSVVASGVLPTCGDELCCANEDASMHAQMPCCETTSITPNDFVRVQSGTSSAGLIVHAPVQAALVATTDATMTAPRPRVQHPVASPVLLEPTPPLFLLNAQFLI
jgi:hypothetical protein